MAKQSYSEQYKDPRWQKRRLEILERDKFTCKKCNSSEDTLHVHHVYYDNALKVWEYEGYYLVTLCESCHEQVHIDYNNLDAELKHIKRSSCYKSVDDNWEKFDADSLFIFLHFLTSTFTHPWIESQACKTLDNLTSLLNCLTNLSESDND